MAHNYQVSINTNSHNGDNLFKFVYKYVKTLYQLYSGQFNTKQALQSLMISILDVLCNLISTLLIVKSRYKSFLLDNKQTSNPQQNCHTFLYGILTVKLLFLMRADFFLANILHDKSFVWQLKITVIIYTQGQTCYCKSKIFIIIIVVIFYFHLNTETTGTVQ